MNRRFATACLWAGAAALVVACAPTRNHSGSDDAVGTVVTANTQASLTPHEIFEDLKAGNERFVAGDLTRFDYGAQVAATASGQYPKAVILSCLDSRVPVETVFDQGIGDVFVGRVAGNFENVDTLGSFEFATAAAGTKLVVVLGHTACGAVKGACDGVELGNLTATLDNLEPAVREARSQVEAPHDSKNPRFVQAAVEANVRITMRDILERSEVIRGMVESGDVMIVGGVYDLATGRVTWMDA